MKILKNTALWGAVLTGLALTTGSAYAVNYTDITTFDGNVSGSPGTWYNRGSASGFGSEDNETESNPATYNGQQWDFEGISYQKNGSNLNVAIVGGVDMYQGKVEQYYDPNHGMFNGGFEAPGDIFLNIDGNSSTPGNAGGYEYALRLHITAAATGAYTYDVLKLNSATTFTLPTDVLSSSPFSVASNYSTLFTGLSLQYIVGKTSLDLANDNIGGVGYGINATGSGFNESLASNPLAAAAREDSHNITVLDMSWLLNVGASNPLLHLTIACGNDSVSGALPSVPDGGATLAMIGLGCSLLAFTSRRFRVKV